jgi:hypothetical protein
MPSRAQALFEKYKLYRKYILAKIEKEKGECLLTIYTNEYNIIMIDIS